MLEDKYPPIIEAVLNDDFETVCLLISQNVNLEEKDKTGDTALTKAATRNKGNVSFEIVKILMESGSKIDALNNSKSTALMHACYFSHLEIMQYLLKNNANWKLIDNQNLSALDYSIKNNIYKEFVDGCNPEDLITLRSAVNSDKALNYIDKKLMYINLLNTLNEKSFKAKVKI